MAYSTPGIQYTDDFKDNQLKHCARQSKCDAEHQ